MTGAVSNFPRGEVSEHRRGATSEYRRGACPTLAAPMQTGDGLLVRLTPRDGEMTMAQLAALAAAAARRGNGLIEITMRGGVQIRGLTAESSEALAEDVAAMGLAVRQGLAIDVNALAGVDPDEIMDPRRLARRISEGVTGSALILGPKVSVTIDSGGQFGLAGLKADIRLRAIATDDGPRWLMMLNLADGARRAFSSDEASIASAALDMLAAIAAIGEQARMGDVTATMADRICAGLAPVEPPAPNRSASPVGVFPTTDGPAMGLTPPFGATDSATLVRLAEAFPDARVRFAPGRGLLLLGLSEDAQAALPAVADRLGLIWRLDDLRLRLAVCAGAPLCASAALATRALADELARMDSAALAAAVAPGQQLHVSGCGKRCGAPSRNVVTLDMPAGAAVVTRPASTAAVAAPAAGDSASSHLSQLSRVLHTLVARHSCGDAPSLTPDAQQSRP